MRTPETKIFPLSRRGAHPAVFWGRRRPLPGARCEVPYSQTTYEVAPFALTTLSRLRCLLGGGEGAEWRGVDQAPDYATRCGRAWLYLPGPALAPPHPTPGG